MKMMMTLAVMAAVGMASMATAETGIWHRFAEYDIGNPNRPCLMDKDKPCPKMMDGKPCHKMLEHHKVKAK